MERKFIIKIYKDYDWEVKLKTLSDYALYPEMNLDIFAIERQTTEHEIVYLFDTDIENSTIEVAKHDPRFKEICKFEYIYNDGIEDKESKHFKSTLAEALEYIQKEFLI